MQNKKSTVYKLNTKKTIIKGFEQYNFNMKL